MFKSNALKLLKSTFLLGYHAEQNMKMGLKTEQKTTKNEAKKLTSKGAGRGQEWWDTARNMKCTTMNSFEKTIL